MCSSSNAPVPARVCSRYKPFSTKAKTRMLREMNNLILSRRTAMCNVLEWKGMKLVYKRCVRCARPLHEPARGLLPSRRD